MPLVRSTSPRLPDGVSRWQRLTRWAKAWMPMVALLGGLGGMIAAVSAAGAGVALRNYPTKGELADAVDAAKKSAKEADAMAKALEDERYRAIDKHFAVLEDYVNQQVNRLVQVVLFRQDPGPPPRTRATP